MSCTHSVSRVLSGQHEHRWCKRCGALYGYTFKLGWTWILPVTVRAEDDGLCCLTPPGPAGQLCTFPGAHPGPCSWQQGGAPCIFCTRPRMPDTKFCERHQGGRLLDDDYEPGRQ